MLFFLIIMLGRSSVSALGYATYHYYTPTTPITSLACSDGRYGLITKGYKGISTMYPYVAAFSGISWGSRKCGRCVKVTAPSGKSIRLTLIDGCGPVSGYSSRLDMSQAAFVELFGTNGINSGHGYYSKIVYSTGCFN